MSDILSQKSMPWGNELLGTSKYYIHAYGASLTALAEILGMTPSDANERLKAEHGFSPDSEGQHDQIIWEKVVPAFPEWSAQLITPYNNSMVLEALSKGQNVIVFVDGAPVGMPGFLHAVRYIGGGKCHDPFTGTERPTADFPDVKSFVVVTRVVAEPKLPAAEVTPALAAEPKTELNPQPEPPAPNPAPAADTTPGPDKSAVTLVNLPAHEKEAIIKSLETALVEIKKALGL